MWTRRFRIGFVLYLISRSILGVEGTCDRAVRFVTHHSERGRNRAKATRDKRDEEEHWNTHGNLKLDFSIGSERRKERKKGEKHGRDRFCFLQTVQMNCKRKVGLGRLSFVLCGLGSAVTRGHRSLGAFTWPVVSWCVWASTHRWGDASCTCVINQVKSCHNFSQAIQVSAY